MLTQQRLKEVLSYNPETGIFTHLRSFRKAVNGQEAGYIANVGYRQIGIDGQRYYAHRLVFLFMEGALPPAEVDHINRVKTDNRWTNLRHADRALQSSNLPVQARSKSGVPGVSWDDDRQRWQAHNYANGKTQFIGRYDHLEEAIAAVA